MKKLLIIAVIVLILASVISAVFYFQANQYAPIDEWSTQLTADKVDWAEAAKGYGIDKCSYAFSDSEYDELIVLLSAVTEENSSRNAPEGSERNEYRLALQYDGKLWLFHCRTNAMVSLTFEDLETGAYYGCEGDLLYIDSPELWDFIVNTVDTKAS